MTAEGDKPTARAITERLVRMRQIVRSTTSDKGTDGQFSIGSGAGSAKSTPRKPRTASATPSSAGSAKRRRVDDGKSTTALPLKAEIDTGSERDAEFELDADFDYLPADTPKKKLFDVPQFSAPATPGMKQVQDQALPPPGSSLGFVKGGEVVVDGSPVKRQSAARSRQATVKDGMVKYADLLDGGDDFFDPRENYVESSASEYIPDAAGFEDDEFA